LLPPKARDPRFKGDFKYSPAGSTFDQELLFLREAIETQNDHVFLHRQTKLPADNDAARAVVEETLEKLLEERAEGVMIRDPSAKWIPKRHKGLLKYKPFEDAEAVVIGYRAGKEGKQGNVLGKIGTLQVRTISLRDNVEFEIGSGLTFENRELATEKDRLWAHEHPGEQMPDKTSSKHIKRGSTITFKYRELSDDGIPKEGRFWRLREGEE
jgi:DNA ligase-1